MAVLQLKIRCHFGNAISRLQDVSESWDADRKSMFAREWDNLRRAGAEMIETRVIKGELLAWPSEDFMLHLKKYGVVL